MEFLLVPESIIGYLPCLVVQLPKAVHPVVLPVALVVPALLVVEGSKAISLAVANVANVLPSMLTCKSHQLSLRLLVLDALDHGFLPRSCLFGNCQVAEDLQLCSLHIDDVAG